MMSKAAYMMQDQLRRNCTLITDVHSPNVFVVRGFLPFPQGLAALAVLFRGKLAADVYSHPYFIEKQSDPSQPSPQLHLTEECQSVMKIIKGLHFMRDDSSKLDNTMVFLTDYTVAAKGRMPTFTSDAEEAAERAERQQRLGEDAAAWEERALRHRWRKTAANQRHSSSGHGGFSHFAQNSPLRSLTRQSHSAEEEQAALEKTRRLVERDGAHTVLYNPIATDPKTFGATVRKLNEEERVVKTIVVPTRQAWGSVNVWAEAFPDAEILCSGAAHPRGAPHRPQQAEERRVGGCMDMGNGVTGLSFPEVEAGECANAEEVSDAAAATAAAADRDNVCRLFLQHSPASNWQDADDEVRRSPRVRPLGDVSQHHITPNIDLVRVAGDDETNEYVIYDSASGALACTDLFHGEYGDLDPVNTWMCRVWFKFMKGGDYKRVDVVPQLKWLQVKRHGSLELLRCTVDRLTRERPVKYLIYAHGTPPRIENPADALRTQWGMPLLGLQEAKKRCAEGVLEKTHE
ncbi:uncharacterized protein Tco025E_04462 [Trypanosoma conorhini]|uniref:Uncharacterized protein n=1 Tax=Trypanosoma conorhini TaxID=83891 RepID=A0A422PL38_9TRYP|nr:uncharacterized protein Tco025E_04462 [Trypanosoma conorhini]RNF18442.1 hypothetical protein Tco025E_04462 [Trypanosoma conorhini]